MKLESIEPNEAARMFWETRVQEVSDATFTLDKRNITEFIEWLECEDIDNMNGVSGRDIHRFKLDMQADLSRTTVSIRMGKVRTFLKFCVDIDAVPAEVPEKVQVPSRADEARDDSVEPDRAEAILEYLDKFEYASRNHALFALVWHTGIRTGTVRSLDKDDFQREKERLRIRHRPETDTPLKNGETAERYIALSSEVTEVLADYVDSRRVDATDGYGREPLFSTDNGRAPKDSIRRWLYGVTRPCLIGDCPYNKEPDDCRAASNLSRAYECEGTVSGHPVRRGAITEFLRRDVPEKVVSDRMNVSQDVLDKHYDVRTEDEKAEQRRKFIDGI